MDNRIRYTIVGLFVMLLMAVGVGIFYWLSVSKREGVYKTYLVFVHEEVTGLTSQSPVRFNGVRVGYVDKITLDPTNPQLVRIQLKILEDAPITTATVATLNTQGITGIIYVSLKATSVNAPPLLPKPGEKYPVIPARPSLLVQLSNVLPEITTKLQLVSHRIALLLDDQNRQAIAETLQNLAKFSKTLSDNSQRLDETMKHLNNAMKNTSTASQQFPEVVKNFNATLNSVRSTSQRISQASQSFNTVIRGGGVAVTNFSTQVIPSTQRLMQRLNRVTQHLENLSQELQRNPSVIIRGKVPPTPGPGEKE